VFTRTVLFALTVLASQSQQNVPPRDAVPATSGSAAISGRITDRDTGRPLHRAIVVLNGAGQTERREAVADAEGRYEFTGLTAGQYSLWASPGELRATHLSQAFGQLMPLTVAASSPRPVIVLKPGEVRSDVDVVLTRALAIEGRVVDSFGEPMSDVELRLKRVDGSSVSGFPVVSDDRGGFRLFGLPPGRYRVCASVQRFSVRSSGPGPPQFRFVDTCYPAAVVESNADDVVLSNEDAVGIDIRMQPVGTSSASGSVVDESGAPIEGAWVDAYRDSAAEGPSSVGGATTVSGGRFTLIGLTPGRYILSAGIGGPLNPDDTKPAARERELGFTALDIAGTDLDGIVVTTSKGQRIAGRVVFEGQPVPRPERLRMVVQMRLPETIWNMMTSRPPYAAVGDDLRFELAGLFRFPQIVGIGGLPDGWALKAVRYNGRDITNLLTEFGNGRERGGLDIVLTNHIAEPAVKVVDDEGSPVSQFFVVVLPADSARWQGALLGAPGRSLPGPVMTLGPRVPGEYFIAALTLEDARILEHDRSRLETLFTAADRVTFEEGDRRTLEIRIRKLPPAHR
jgi:protocatechuate 3,4-dioxygenase beta subunit